MKFLLSQRAADFAADLLALLVRLKSLAEDSQVAHTPNLSAGSGSILTLSRINR